MNRASDLADTDKTNIPDCRASFRAETLAAEFSVRAAPRACPAPRLTHAVCCLQFVFRASRQLIADAADEASVPGARTVRLEILTFGCFLLQSPTLGRVSAWESMNTDGLAARLRFLFSLVLSDGR